MMIPTIFLDINLNKAHYYICDPVSPFFQALRSHSHNHLALTRPAEDDDAKNPAKRIRLETDEMKQEADVANLQKPQLGFYLGCGNDPHCLI